MVRSMGAGVLGVFLCILPLGIHPARASGAGGEGPGAAAPRAAETLATLLRDLRHDDAARRETCAAAVLLRVAHLDPPATRTVEAAVLRALEGERSPQVRAALYAVLGRSAGEGARSALLLALHTEEAPEAQSSLVEALGDLATDRIATDLSTLAFSVGPVGPRCLAAEALGRLSGERPLRTLLALADTTHPWAVEAAVLESLGLRTHPEAVERALRRIGDLDPAVHAAARHSLELLLGRDEGDDAKAWRRAWDSIKDRWPGIRQEGPAPAGDGREHLSIAEARPEVRTTARFFGIPVTGRRVAFVLDCSQSMWGEKVESARLELAAAVKGLRPGRRFGVVFFNEKVWTWRDDLDFATPARKWALVEALQDSPTRSYTNIHDALERAFAWAGRGRLALPGAPGLDEIFLLSDGEPNRGRLRDTDRIAEAVALWNEGKTVRLHAVALGSRAPALLQRLAGENGGTCVLR